MTVAQEGYRHRESGLFNPSAPRASFWWNTSQNPKPSPSYSTRPESLGTRRFQTDYVTKRYKERSANGEIFNKPLSAVTWERSATGTGPVFRAIIGATTYYGELIGPGWDTGQLKETSLPTPSSLPDYSNLYSLVHTRCLANIDKPDYALGVSIGEFRETVNFLRNPLQSVIALGDTLNGRLRRAGVFNKSVPLKRNGKIREEIAAIYLAYNFGLVPLAKEVVGILENLRPSLFPKPKRQTARAKEEVTYTKEWSALESISGGISYTAEYTYKRTVTVKSGILYEHSVAATDASKWGLRPKDIPLAVWQVTSLSFVVDWLFNVGEFISAITPSAGTRTLAMWTTTIVDEVLVRTTRNYVFNNASGYITYTDGTGTDYVKRRTYYRDPANFAPALASKGFAAVENDVGKLTSLLALATTRLKVATPYQPKNLFDVRGPKGRDRWIGTSV